MRLLMICALCVVLTGCGIAVAQREYHTSEAQYKACLTANPAAPQNCEGLRLAMEADERKYEHLTGSGNSITVRNR
jgi:hypothetical protein